MKGSYVVLYSSTPDDKESWREMLGYGVSDDPKALSAKIKEWNHELKLDGSSGRYRIQCLTKDNTEWIRRETERFLSAEYIPCPWDRLDNGVPVCNMTEWTPSSPRYGEMFPHMSKDKRGYVAYTPSPEYGIRDRKIRKRVGVYLRETFFALPESTIEAWVIQLGGADVSFRLATTREEIRNVYMNGPRSCMSHDIEDYRSDPYHPTEVYASGDFGVAYMVRHENESERITARVVVALRAKVILGCIYGDESRFEPLLAREGFERRSFYNVAGLRLLKIPMGNRYVAPYLDFSNGGLGSKGEYLVFGEGSLYADECGLTGYSRECRECGIDCNDDYRVVYDEYWCGDCYYNEFGECWSCGERTPHIDLVEGPDGYNRCDECHDARFADCETCGETVNRDEMEGVECLDCYDENHGSPTVKDENQNEMEI